MNETTPIFGPDTDPDDVGELIDQLTEALETNDLGAAVKQPIAPGAAKVWSDFWKAVTEWIAAHPLIGEVDPATPQG